jgi:FHS family L-fucose permease-like MFS transporter
MAILGGAVLTAIQGKVSDMTGSINWAYSIPLLCFVVVGIYGWWSATPKSPKVDFAE